MWYPPKNRFLFVPHVSWFPMVVSPTKNARSQEPGEFQCRHQRLREGPSVAPGIAADLPDAAEADLAGCDQSLDAGLSHISYYQWEFQDPKMEVLYHVKPYFVGYSLTYALYMVGTSILGSWNSHWYYKLLWQYVMIVIVVSYWDLISIITMIMENMLDMNGITMGL